MCNSAGQTLGIFLGYNLSVLLISESFWNKWWRTSPLPDGVITLQGTFLFIIKDLLVNNVLSTYMLYIFLKCIFKKTFLAALEN
jgi:hypothetical protein